jgi:hypothetical protein
VNASNDRLGVKTGKAQNEQMLSDGYELTAIEKRDRSAAIPDLDPAANPAVETALGAIFSRGQVRWSPDAMTMGLNRLGFRACRAAKMR